MNKFFVLLFICHQTLFENLVFVSLTPTDPLLETTTATNSKEKDYDLNWASIDQFSGTCPNSGCRGKVADFHDYNPPKSGCYCDKTCIGLRDCCKDSVFYDEEEQRKPRTLDCVDDLPYHPNGYYVDRGCPRSWKNEEFIEKCAISRQKEYNTADLRLMVPVTSLSSGVTYGNVFCALCNGEDNLVIWRMIVNDFCTNTIHKLPTADDYVTSVENLQLDNATDLKFNGQHWYVEKFEKEYVCELSLGMPEEDVVELKRCKPHLSFKRLVKDSCPENWTDVTVLNQCKGAYALVYHNSDKGYSQMYKNKFCAYCNGLNDTQLFCRPTSFAMKSSTIGFRETGAIPVTFYFNMSISDTEFCHRKLTNGKNLTATEKRLCPIDALGTKLFKKKFS